MSIFAPPIDPNRNIKFRLKKPWKKSQNNQISNYNSLVASSSSDSSLSLVKFKLNLAQIIAPLFNFFGYLLVFAGLLLIITCLPGKRYSAHPFLFGSYLYTLLAAAISIVMAFVLWHFGSKLTIKRNEWFKKDIVQRRMDSFFQITEYVYNELEQGRVTLATFIESLKIKDGKWNRFTYNDYFRGVYHNSPFIFFDFSLINHINLGKNSCDVNLFSGQLILFELNLPLTDSEDCYRFEISQEICDSMLSADGLNIEACSRPTNMNALLRGTKKLIDLQSVREFTDQMAKLADSDEVDKVVEQLNQNLSEIQALEDECKKEGETGDVSEEKLARLTEKLQLGVQLTKQLPGILGIPEVEDEEADEGTQVDTEALIRQQFAALMDLRDAAQCDIGMVVYGRHLVLILYNNFDPFEFGFRETFKTSGSLLKGVDAQIGWMQSIFESLEKTGWIGQNTY